MKLLKQTAAGFTMFNISNYFEANSKILAVVVLSVFLTACGAGGAGSEDPALSEASVDTNIGSENTVEEVVANVKPVVITTQPESITAMEGGLALFSVAATGGGQLSFQWNKGGVELVGETSSSLMFSNTEVSNAGQYSVVVTNAVGSLTSLAALLTVQVVPVVEPPVVVEPPSVLASVELSWDIPVAREDGSYLALGEIGSYVIKYGTDTNNLNLTMEVDVNSAESVVIEELDAGTYYFAIATIDSDGTQGAYSTQLEQVVL